MIDRHHPDHADHAELTEQDLAIATLVGRYIERRESGQPPRPHDRFAVAAEFGDAAVDVLRTVLAWLRGDAHNRRPRAVTQQHRHLRPKRCAMHTLTRPSSIRSGSLR